VADGRTTLQKTIDKLDETCKAYGMEIYVKKTKVMIVNETDKPNEVQRCVMLYGKVCNAYGKVPRFKCIGSWITELGWKNRGRYKSINIAQVDIAKATFRRIKS
jgi:hypothetical protein